MSSSEPTQTIRVTDGAAEYTWPITITETTGRDIRLATIQLSLGTATDPTTWQNPAIDTSPGNNARRTQILIPTTTPPGTYWLWTKTVIDAETIIRRHHQIAAT